MEYRKAPKMSTSREITVHFNNEVRIKNLL